jgi:hypothetical protein
MKRAFVIGLTFGLLGSYAGIKFLTYASTPFFPRSREEDFRQVLGGKAPRNPTAAPEGENKYRGQFMTFKYPATARFHEIKGTAPGMLERVDLEIDIPRLSITAAAVETKEKVLKDVPGVKMRRQQTDLYSEHQTIVGVEKNPIFTKTDGKEKTVFVIYHERLYTLSVTGNDPEAVARLWAEILPTFHFL